jgi:hypothetical protein
MSEAPHAGMLQNAARHAQAPPRAPPPAAPRAAPLARWGSRARGGGQGPPSIFATGEYRGPKERPLRAAKPSASNNASTPKQARPPPARARPSAPRTCARAPAGLKMAEQAAEDPLEAGEAKPRILRPQRQTLNPNPKPDGQEPAAGGRGGR